MTSSALSNANSSHSGVKRIMRELKEFDQARKEAQQQNRALEVDAQACEDSLFDWHFTLRGPDESDFAFGLYHGRIMLPATYPFAPPDIMLLTPSGRFECRTKICLSITSFHEQQWSAAWSIKTVLMAMRAFMTTPGGGAIGALDHSPHERQELARRSRKWRCEICQATCEELMPTVAAVGPNRRSSNNATTATQDEAEEKSNATQSAQLSQVATASRSQRQSLSNNPNHCANQANNSAPAPVEFVASSDREIQTDHNAQFSHHERDKSAEPIQDTANSNIKPSHKSGASATASAPRVGPALATSTSTASSSSNSSTQARLSPSAQLRERAQILAKQRAQLLQQQSEAAESTSQLGDERKSIDFNNTASASASNDSSSGSTDRATAIQTSLVSPTDVARSAAPAPSPRISRFGPTGQQSQSLSGAPTSSTAATAAAASNAPASVASSHAATTAASAAPQPNDSAPASAPQPQNQPQPAVAVASTEQQGVHQATRTESRDVTGLGGLFSHFTDQQVQKLTVGVFVGIAAILTRKLLAHLAF